jgi:two-component system chemotaxis sensor kinase CheA
MISEEKGLENSASTLAYIDQLITCLLVSGLNAVRPENLDELAACAEQEGLKVAASMAKSLSKEWAKEGMNEDARQKLLCEGLADVRDAVSNSEEEVAPAKRDVEASQPASSPSSSPSPSSSSSFAEDTELITDFLVEAREHLSLIESQMLELERNSGSLEVLHSVFRTFHTIKGLAGFLEFYRIQEVSHEVETLLDLARNEKMRITPPVVDVVLESADYLNTELNRIESEMGGAAPSLTVDNRELINKIKALAEGKAAGNVQPNVDEASAAGAAGIEGAAESRQIVAAASIPLTEKPVARTGEAAKSPDTSSVRVETAKLDHLLDMVGEMVIAQSLIRHNPVLAETEDARLLADIAQLTRNTAEVQRITMAMRMIPIGQLFQRTARLVRDLSRKVGKDIVLETSGEDTELDKTIAEELTDPLLHMVRNSVDHGIEKPEERVASGKSREARIFLRAYHQAGQVVIEIADDGRGLNRERILAKAVQNGVIEKDAQLSDSEIYQLIFEPGFSTAEKITDVSGRGVGMDVVRRNVEKLRGRIDTHSEPGKGTTFHLRLPLTLAIIEGLVVMVGASRYVVPIFAVREMFRPTPELLSTVQGKHEMALVRGNLLPIVRLHRRFNIPSKTVDPSQGLLVVIECNERQFCLLVDDLAGKQEVVIKSLGETFKDISGLAGCAILGDGRVGLILDMDGIYQENAG